MKRQTTTQPEDHLRFISWLGLVIPGNRLRVSNALAESDLLFNIGDSFRGNQNGPANGIVLNQFSSVGWL
jgi:hypothetical protein